MESTKFLFLIRVIILVVLLGLSLSFPVMWLWNTCLIPAVPGLQPIGWLQAWGISTLCNALFKDFSSAVKNA